MTFFRVTWDSQAWSKQQGEKMHRWCCWWLQATCWNVQRHRIGTGCIAALMWARNPSCCQCLSWSWGDVQNLAWSIQQKNLVKWVPASPDCRLEHKKVMAPTWHVLCICRQGLGLPVDGTPAHAVGGYSHPLCPAPSCWWIEQRLAWCYLFFLMWCGPRQCLKVRVAGDDSGAPAGSSATPLQRFVYMKDKIN